MLRCGYSAAIPGEVLMESAREVLMPVHIRREAMARLTGTSGVLVASILGKGMAW